MHRDHEIGVVVPAYNEEGFVGDVVLGMPDYVDRIYVVDDQSTDSTWDEILNAAESDASYRTPERAVTTLMDGGQIEERSIVHERIGRVVPIRHLENRGAGGAIKTGYLLALADRVDIVVTVDGDGQMDLDQMSRLLDPIVEGRVDYAKGNRIRSVDPHNRMPTFRFVGNSILTFLTRIASGYWTIMDPQNGYTAISRDALEAVTVEEMYEYYGYCNDLLVKLSVRDMRVGDVTMVPIYGDEQSTIKYTEYIPKVSGMLFRNFLWRLKMNHLVGRTHPLAISYITGALTSAIATVAGLWSAFTRMRSDERSFGRGLSSLLLFVVGWLLVLLGIVLDRRHNEQREVRVDD
ncbi:glycosyltransferase [Halomontanus rarus]|uniref:glycosyltransferase n=1 Tax=Halomontanus rarus TaxID=3034020 RepID=UPI001A98C95D